MTYWKPVFQENWREYALGDLPDTYRNIPWIGANQPTMYTRIMQGDGLSRYLACGGTPIPKSDDGARAFLVSKNGVWSAMSEYENQIVRLRSLLIYPTPFTIAQGAGNYCQVFVDGKTNSRPNAEIQIGIESIEGKAYHWVRGVNGFKDSQYSPGNYQYPVEWNTPLEYELQIYLSRFSDGWFTFKYKGLELHAEGPNLDADTGFFAPALCAYTNALESGQFEVQYSSTVLEVAA